MIYTKLSAKKSRTIGTLDSHGKTRFKKIEFQADVELDESDDPATCRQELSTFIDNYLSEEAAKASKK